MRREGLRGEDARRRPPAPAPHPDHRATRRPPTGARTAVISPPPSAEHVPRTPRQRTAVIFPLLLVLVLVVVVVVLLMVLMLLLRGGALRDTSRAPPVNAQP